MVGGVKGEGQIGRLVEEEEEEEGGEIHGFCLGCMDEFIVK